MEASTQATPTLRVIIGEDDVLLREGIARILEGAGLNVVARAGDADELLRKILAFRPDIAIVDVRMPPGWDDDGPSPADPAPAPAPCCALRCHWTTGLQPPVIH